MSDRDYCYDCGYAPCRCEELKKERQKELEAYCPTFEDFLSEKHVDAISNTEDDCLDDELSDALDGWIGSLDGFELQKYAEEYGLMCFRKGQKVGR